MWKDLHSPQDMRNAMHERQKHSILGFQQEESNRSIRYFQGFTKCDSTHDRQVFEGYRLFQVETPVNAK
jgi:hypothetical protein